MPLTGCGQSGLCALARMRKIAFCRVSGPTTFRLTVCLYARKHGIPSSDRGYLPAGQRERRAWGLTGSGRP